MRDLNTYLNEEYDMDGVSTKLITNKDLEVLSFKNEITFVKIVGKYAIYRITTAGPQSIFQMIMGRKTEPSISYVGALSMGMDETKKFYSQANITKRANDREMLDNPNSARSKSLRKEKYEGMHERLYGSPLSNDSNRQREDDDREAQLQSDHDWDFFYWAAAVEDDENYGGQFGSRE